LKSLKAKYPELSLKLVNNYYGYINQAEICEKNNHHNLNIAYGGIFKATQSPQILAEAVSNMQDSFSGELYFIGNYKKYLPILDYVDKYNFSSAMPHSEYVEFMLKNIDVGFVSLANDYFGACVPSKIYEYINLGLPIIGTLPKGDAMDIINENEYGIACKYDDLKGIQQAILKISDKNNYNNFRNNILNDRNKWAMKDRIHEVVEWLKNI
jgi:hypothetical protein